MVKRWLTLWGQEDFMLKKFQFEPCQVQNPFNGLIGVEEKKDYWKIIVRVNELINYLPDTLY